jgi:hypothetical protein
VVSGFFVSISRDLVRTKTVLCENKDANNADVSASRGTRPGAHLSPLLQNGAARPNRSLLCPLAHALPKPEEPTSDGLKGLCRLLLSADLRINSSATATLLDVCCFARLVFVYLV